MDKATLYRHVSFIRKELSLIHRQIPLHMVTLLPEVLPVRIQHHMFETQGLCAAVYFGKYVDTIMLNEYRTPAQQNFDCAHETMHIMLHKPELGIAQSCFSDASKGSNPALEWQANEGAAELLVPYAQFLPMVAAALAGMRHRPDGMLGFTTQLAAHFFVPEATIAIRFESLKYELQQYRAGTSLEDIRIVSGTQQQRLGINARSLASYGNLRASGRLSVD